MRAGASEGHCNRLEKVVTCRDRGTLHTKSPEMLEAANAAKTWANSFDRRKLRGAGAPSDVWSLGCLLYELLTGKRLAMTICSAS